MVYSEMIGTFTIQTDTDTRGTTDLIFLGNRELAFITTVKLIHPRSSLYISPISARRDKYIHRLYLKQKQIKSKIFAL